MVKNTSKYRTFVQFLYTEHYNTFYIRTWEGNRTANIKECKQGKTINVLTIKSTEEKHSYEEKFNLTKFRIKSHITI
jgi:hypothetical protein